MKIWGLAIVMLLSGFAIGMNVADMMINNGTNKTETRQQPTCHCVDSTLAPAIHRLTDAILAGADTMVQESNETQAIWKEIRDKHYSPY